MKLQKGNSFQLIIAGVVLVAVAVSGTIAWFASSNSANVNSITAVVSSPSIGSGIDAIEYYENDQWKNYNGKELSIIPGQTLNFRVSFSCSSTQSVDMKLKDIEVDGESFDNATIPSFLGLLKYNVNSGAYSTLTSGLSFNPNNSNKPEIVIPIEELESQSNGGQSYTCFYSITWPNETSTYDNNYFDKSISFNLELVFTDNG